MNFFSLGRSTAIASAMRGDVRIQRPSNRPTSRPITMSVIGLVEGED